MKYKSLFLFAAALTLTAGCSEIQAATAESSAEEAVTTATASAESETTETATEESYPALLKSPADIALSDVDGGGWDYTFTYDETVFHANYLPDKWQIIDSYRIRNRNDIEMICQALSDVHPIHNADYTGYRSAGDMAHEWHQHNVAFDMLPEGSEWKESAKDVDLDPQDENKSMYRMFKDKIAGSY